MTIKTAAIGVGSMGKNHARVYHQLSNAELVAVCDASEATAANIAAAYGVPYETDYRAMLDRYQPEAVSVSVPTNLHYEVAKEIIGRGVHLLIEKPIAETVAQAQEIIDLAEAAGVKLGVGHIERFNPAVVELKKRLDGEQVGKPFRVQARRMGPFPARIRDVGVIIDLASHDLDMIRYIMDTEVTRVYAETAHGINTDREDMVDAVVRCENDVVGTLNVNWMTPTKIRELTVIGSQGMFLVNYLTQELYFYENVVAPTEWHPLSVLTGVGEGNMVRFQFPRHEPLRAELENFVDAVSNDRAPLVSGEDGMKALRLAQALVDSGKTQQVISL